MEIKGNKRVLFNGDSITDWMRDHSDRHSLTGYNKRIAQAYADSGAEFFNRAISGDRTTEMLARMDADLADTDPDYVSILIGINDTWRRFDSNLPTSGEKFRENLRANFEKVKKYGAKLIVLEPFLLPVDPAKRAFREDLDEKIDITRELAREFAEEYIPLDGLFAEVVLKVAPETLSADGVHPTDKGFAYIAQWWMQRVKCVK